jgi:SAM-dependent methyltransferase
VTDWSFDAWPPVAPDWANAGQGHRPDDQLDFHVDLGCGKLKKGRIGVDRYPAPGVNIVADLDAGRVFGVSNEPGVDAVDLVEETGRSSWGAGDGTFYDYVPGCEMRTVIGPPGGFLPFEDSSVDSMISHHALEHIGEGFIPLMDECYRVLKPGATFRIITPLYPSTTAVEDPDHKRYFMDGTFDAFCGFPDHHWCESFSVPYTKARFECTDKDMTALLPPEQRWTDADRREIRVTLRPRK